MTSGLERLVSILNVGNATGHPQALYCRVMCYSHNGVVLIRGRFRREGKLVIGESSPAPRSYTVLIS